jgi:hypothetical protein
MPQRRRSSAHFINPTPRPAPAGPEPLLPILGIPRDDPVFPFVGRFIYRAAREGQDIYDPDVIQQCLGYARIALAMAKADAQEILSRENTCWVYYLRVGDLIKIGTATNLARRLAEYPPNAQLLAVEQGYLRKEAERLAEFAEHLSARREWFAPGPRLMAHIAAIHDPERLARCVAPPEGER